MTNETGKAGQMKREPGPDLSPLPRRGHTLAAGAGQRVLSDVIVHDLTTVNGTAFAVIEYLSGDKTGRIESISAVYVRFGPRPESEVK